MKLEEIGFYTLSDERAMNASSNSSLYRCELLITKKCNFHCPYCRSVGQELAAEQAYETVSLWRGMGLKNVRFSGGEPTQNLPSLISGVVAARGCDHIAVSTNGSAEKEIYKMLIDIGVNDFSVSLDACCASVGDKLAGRDGMFKRVVENIKYIASRGVYITVGIVVINETEERLRDVIAYADSLGVSDVRPIPAAQWKNTLSIPVGTLEKYPILKYRSQSRLFRGNPAEKCPLVLDDMAVMGDKHYPCIIYMREGGNPIGTVSRDMRKERNEWYMAHNPRTDGICANQCLDVCREYNNRHIEFRKILGVRS